jgi:chaperone modulatory protein CbpM
MRTPQTPSPLSGATPEPPTDLTLVEVSRTCAVTTGFVIELVEEGVISPLEGREPEGWRFAGSQLRHVSVAARLQRDLGINLAGAALALQLLDELETLRAQITASGAGQDAD